MDRMLKALSSRPRRRLLLNLMERNPRNAAAQPAELGIGGDAGTASTRIHHVHLPLLEEAGYIDWDRETGEIVKGPEFGEIRPLLELMKNHADELPDDWV